MVADDALEQAVGQVSGRNVDGDEQVVGHDAELLERQLDGRQLEVAPEADLARLREPPIRGPDRVVVEARQRLEPDDPPGTEIGDGLEGDRDGAPLEHRANALNSGSLAFSLLPFSQLVLPKALGQRGALTLEAQVQRTRLQQVAGAEDDFGDVERFREEVVGAGLEHSRPYRWVDVVAEHDHGNEVTFDDLFPQGLHEMHAVGVAEVEVDHDEVRLVPGEELAGTVRFGCCHGDDALDLLQHRLQQQDVVLLVVDDENAHLTHGPNIRA